MAALLLSASAMAQTMSLKIEGYEIKNGDVVEITKPANKTVLNPVLTMYDLGIEVEFKSLIAQTVETEGVDLDQITPGLACCPTGFTCTTASANNGWKSTGTMNDLAAGREVNGEWIHYNYGANKDPQGATRKSTITLKGKSETISFSLSITDGDKKVVINGQNVTAVETLQSVEKATDGVAYTLDGKVAPVGYKGVVVINGKKILK